MTDLVRLILGILASRFKAQRWKRKPGPAANPTAEWISRQVTEAFTWDHAPRYLNRDRDTSYGPAFLQRIRAMGIRDHPIAPRSNADRQDFVSLKICKRRSISDPRSAVVSLPGLPDDCAG
jgi:hypothetical protein